MPVEFRYGRSWHHETPQAWLDIWRPAARFSGRCKRCLNLIDDHAETSQYLDAGDGFWLCRRILPAEHVNPLAEDGPLGDGEAVL